MSLRIGLIWVTFPTVWSLTRVKCPEIARGDGRFWNCLVHYGSVKQRLLELVQRSFLHSSVDCKRIWFGFGFACTLPPFVIGLKMARHFVIQWELKPKPMVTRSYRFSRAFASTACARSLIGSLRLLCTSWLARVVTLVFSFLTLNWKRLSVPRSEQLFESVAGWKL